MTDYKETLRRLALNDEQFAESLGMGLNTGSFSNLDPKIYALARLGASLAIDAAPSTYHSHVEAAAAEGATVDEIVGTLVAVAPVVGLARVVSAAPELALALGYDVDAALESRGAVMSGAVRASPFAVRRAPHRVGRRALRHLVEHRMTAGTAGCARAALGSDSRPALGR